MKERPIPLYQHEVLAIIDGRQTQLRRVVKQPIEGRRFGDSVWPAFTKPHVIDGFEAIGVDAVNNGGLGLIKKPCCVPGDRLWGRETWADVNSEDGPALMYRSGYAVRSWREFSKSFGPDFGAGPSMDYESYPGDYVMWHDDLAAYDMGHHKEDGYRWRPSIHMPRWASRITLEVTDVRVERLNEISDVDAMREGIPVPEAFLGVSPDGMPIENPDADGYHPVDAFRELWGSINGEGSWGANPWVWVVTFKRLEVTS